MEEAVSSRPAARARSNSSSRMRRALHDALLVLGSARCALHRSGGEGSARNTRRGAGRQDRDASNRCEQRGIGQYRSCNSVLLDSIHIACLGRRGTTHQLCPPHCKVASKYEGASPLFGLINNAGVGFGKSIPDTLDVNTYGPKRVCDAFIPLLDPEVR